MDDEAQHYGREDGIVCFFLFSGHVEALQIHILTANIRVNEGLWLIYVSLCWPITKKQITVVLLTKEIEGEMEQWDCVGPLNFFPKSFCNKHTHIYIYIYTYIYMYTLQTSSTNIQTTTTILYIPGTQISPVLIGVKAFFWRVFQPQNRGQTGVQVYTQRIHVWIIYLHLP